VARRQRLSEIQIAELFDPPTEQRELVRYYTLSEADLAAIARCRGDHNRLGYALMRCYLRYPGRVLHVGERPPAAMLEFVAEQIGVFPASIDEYLASERNRQRHAIECREQIGLRYFGKHAAAELTQALLPQAMEDDRLAHLAALAMEACRLGGYCWING
jgi:TnpA family transposase